MIGDRLSSSLKHGGEKDVSTKVVRKEGTKVRSGQPQQSRKATEQVSEHVSQETMGLVSFF